MFLRRMKDFRLLLLMGIALVFVGQSLCAQSRAEQKEKEAEQVKELLESGRFTIEVDRALPMQGKPVNLTTLYSLEDALLAGVAGRFGSLLFTLFRKGLFPALWWWRWIAV